MADTVSSWAIAQAMGRPRDDIRTLWQRWELLPAAQPDGLYRPEDLERVRAARALSHEARRLPGRALLVHRDGHFISVSTRRAAMADVLRHMSRSAHKTAQILWELQALRSAFVPPGRLQPVLLKLEVSSDRLADVLLAARDHHVGDRYQYLDLYARSLPGLGVSKRVPLTDPIGFHERIALLMAAEVLHENFVRNRMGLEPRAPRYGPPTDGQERSADAPRLRGQLPPKRIVER